MEPASFVAHHCVGHKKTHRTRSRIAIRVTLASHNRVGQEALVRQFAGERAAVPDIHSALIADVDATGVVRITHSQQPRCSPATRVYRESPGSDCRARTIGAQVRDSSR